MTEKYAELDGALDRVVAAARAHLAAVKAAAGQPDDDTVWREFVALNNTAREYDELLNDVFGEVTPWDLELISADEPPAPATVAAVQAHGDEVGDPDPYPVVISVRQRRDYRVPSVAALLRIAAETPSPVTAVGADQPIASVADAVVELLQSGDGSLGMLDVAELEPLDGLVVVAEVTEPLDVHTQDDSDTYELFALGSDDRVVARLAERAFADVDPGPAA